MPCAYILVCFASVWTVAPAASSSRTDMNDVSFLQHAMEINQSERNQIGEQVTEGVQVPVFYLGLQKSGTTSFAGFMDDLGFETFHTPTFKTFGLYPETWDTWLRELEGPAPMYDAFVSEMCPNARAEFATWLGSQTSFAASDGIWPLLFQFLDESTNGKAKFVIWQRDANDWADSWFTMMAGGVLEGRFWQLSYGEADAHDISREQLLQAYESHVSTVLEYFNTTDRSARFLSLDFTAPDAGRSLCNFALGDTTSCEKYTILPNVDASELDLDANLEFESC